MANLGKTPGDGSSEPVESRRTTLTEADPAQTATDSVPDESGADLPALGELSPEAARPTPLDEIAEAERENAPRD